MARHSGAIVIEGPFGDGDWLDDARRIADAARSLNGATRRMGGQLRATAAGYISAVSKTVRAVEGLRDEQLLAFGDTARAWESARTRLNGLSASLGALKRSLRDAFVPILTAAAPALTTLTNLLARAVSAVGAFMAALTGQDAFLRATGEQRDYAGGLRGSTRAAKALKRQLASFDELDILRDREEGSGGGGFAGAVERLSGQLALLPIDEGILNFARQLKALFEAGDYDGLGRTIADAVNGAIDKAREWIRWENVGEDVTRVIDGVCEAFNGLVDGVDWTNLGGALGDGIDTLLRAANRLLADIDFPALGRALGDALNGAMAEIDFDVLGETLARLLTAKLEVLAGAAITFDWGQFGGKLAEGLNGLLRTMGEALDGIDWSELAMSLAGGLNRFIDGVDWAGVGGFAGSRLSDALGALRTAVTTFEWGSAGDALADAVNGLVREVDWIALGQWLDRTIQGVLDFGIRFLQGFDSEEFASGLKQALDEVDWDGIAEKLWTLMAEAMGKLGGLGNLLGLGGSPLDGLAPGGGRTTRAEADVQVRLVKRGWTSIGEFIGTAVQVATNLGKGNWRSLSEFVGPATQVLVSLEKDGWGSIAGFVGSEVTTSVSLAKRGWNTLSAFVGDSVTVKTGLQRDGWTSLAGFIGAKSPVSALVNLAKHGWSTLSGFVGTGSPVSALVSLAKHGWSTLSGFTGDAVSVRTSLTKNGWSTISGFVGSSVSVGTQLLRWGWSSIEDFVGDEVSVWTQLVRWGWSSLAQFVGSNVEVFTALRKNGWSNILSYVTGNSQGIITLTANIATGVVSGFLAGLRTNGKAAGGYITAGGLSRSFASGGVIAGGVARYLGKAPHYAGGTTRAHGTVFVAGEAGPEIMGHINGRTEILNKSQIAQAIYGAVVSGMGAAVNALGRCLCAQMASCANAIVTTLGNVGGLAALGGVDYRAPVLAGGSVLPYEVSARFERTGAELRGALEANNEDLIQTIISVVGAQTSALVSAIQSAPRGGEGGLSAQQLIGEINRRTQMYSQSPIKGV